MLKGFRVQNFKAFKDTTPIELKPITLLSGINSAGKSALLQALLLLKQTLESGPAQVLNPGGPLFFGMVDNFLFDGADGKEEPLTLTYDLTFTYQQDLEFLDTLRGSFPDMSSGLSTEEIVYDLRLAFAWGGLDYHKRRSVHVDDLQVTLKIGHQPLLGLDIFPEEREGAYRVRLVEHDTLPGLKNLAFEQLRIDSFAHFLPESFIVMQPKKTDPLRDLPPQLAQFFRQLFRRIRDDLSEKIYYLSSFREPPQPSYPGFSTASVLNPYGSNFPQVLWQHREMPVRFEHVGLPYPDKRRPYEMSLYTVVAWILREILQLEQSVEVQPVGRQENILEVRVETLGSKSASVTLADVGLGYNQILPIVVQGLLTPPGDLVVFEQPEIHLHPDVQAKLVPFFVGLAKAGRQVLVETHSNHMVDHLCLAIAQDQRAEDWLVNNASVLFVHPPDQDHAGARIEPVQIDPYGRIVNWPLHFMPDTAGLYEAILKAGFAKRRTQQTRSEGGV